MGHRITAGIAVVVALGCAGGAFYWLHRRGEAQRPATALITSANPIDAPTTARSLVGRGEISAAAPNTKKTTPAVDPAIPLRTGETLEFTANVAKLNNVANLRLQIAEKRSFLGKSAWHLQAFAHTVNPLRIVFEVDDQFDSYSDAGTLASLQYEMHLSERGQKVESVQRMTPDGKEPAPADASAARVLPGTRDPLGMMQYLRNVDWTRTPEVRSPVYDGHKLYDVRAKLESASEAVTVPVGSYTASKIEIRVFDNGTEMKDAHFALYTAHDPGRTPVLLEATMPFATARVELVKIQ